MELHERIKELRKNHLNLSQTAFGEKLGVSRSVINNIERNVLARPDQKLSLLKLICSEFNVSEEWLLNGIGPMYVAEPTFSLDDFVKQNHATDLELEIMKAYFERDPDLRKAVIDHFKNRLLNNEASDNNDGLFDSVPDTPEELEKRFPPVEESDSEVS